MGPCAPLRPLGGLALAATAARSTRSSRSGCGSACSPWSSPVFPSDPGRIEVAELSTPLSTRHFAGHPSGEIYGLEATPRRF